MSGQRRSGAGGVLGCRRLNRDRTQQTSGMRRQTFDLEVMGCSIVEVVCALGKVRVRQ